MISRKAGKYRHLPAVCLTKGQFMFKQLFSVFYQTRLTSAVSLTHHKSVSKTCVVFMIGRNNIKYQIFGPDTVGPSHKNFTHTSSLIFSLFTCAWL